MYQKKILDDTINVNFSYYIPMSEDYNFSNARFFCGSGGIDFGEKVAKELGVEISPSTIKEFSCGEKYVRYDETVRGKDVFLFHTIRTNKVNEDFMELFLLCNAAKQSFAKTVHVILPHYGYARQDKIHDARETISAKLMADLLVKSGANHVITLHLHSDQIQGFFDVPLDNISTMKMFVNYFKNKDVSDLMIVSPDAGGAKSAKKFADLLGVDLAIMHKTRPAHNVAEVTEVVGEIEGKTCILVDDIVDTAGSVCAAKKALIAHGANEDVYLCATHPVFSGPAVDRLNEAKFKEIVVSDSIPVQGEIPALHVLSAAPLLSEIIKNVVAEKSVSGLYF